jgi:hypothetical protein
MLAEIDYAANGVAPMIPSPTCVLDEADKLCNCLVT